MARAKLLEAYYTVVIPFSAEPTIWHPTSRDFAPIGRGAFADEASAHDWAAERLNGQPYTLQYTPKFEESEA